MSRGVAYRRAQVRRLKRERAHWWGLKLCSRQLGKAVWTPAICSCWMCGNPRRHGRHERTIQERRFMQAKLHTED